MATITANISASDTTIPVSAEVDNGFYTIDSENVYVHGSSRGAQGRAFDRLFLSVDRGIGGSTAATHTSGATLTRYYPDAASSEGGGLPIVDGRAEVAATLTLLVPEGATQDSPLFSIVPDADWSGSDGVLFAVVDPGGDPTENFGIFEITEAGNLFLGQAGNYSIQLDSDDGEISARQLSIAVDSGFETPLSTVAKADGGANLSKLQHQASFGGSDDGALTFWAMPAGSGTIRFRVLPDGHVLMPALPTADPAVAGSLWIDTAAGRVLKVSAG